MNEITSKIIFKFGHIGDLAGFSHKDSKGVLIKLERADKNSVKVSCNFDETNLTKEKALKYTEKVVKSIALTSSLKYKVSSEWDLNISSSWQENSQSSQRTITLSADCAIELKVDIKNMPISNNLQHSIECFNYALFHKELNPDDNRAIAIWLRLSWESLKAELLPNIKNDNDLKEDIIRYNIISISSKGFNYFKRSMCCLHVHKTNEKPLSIEKCLEHMQTILLYYSNKPLI